VTITINLDAGEEWALANTEENVKIQDCDFAPWATQTLVGSIGRVRQVENLLISLCRRLIFMVCM